MGNKKATSPRGSWPSVAALMATVFLLLPTQALSSFILNPGNVISSTIPPHSGSYTSSFALDQSGLSVGYTSGVTDFDTYFAGNPAHTLSGVNTHFLSSSSAPGTIDFDLGAVTALDGFALWNWHNSNGGVGVTSVSVFSSNDAAFTSTTSLGTFGFSLVPTTAQLVEFSSQASTQYVRLSLSGNGNLIGFGELAFEQAEANIPAPPIYWLFGAGIFGLVSTIKRKKS